MKELIKIAYRWKIKVLFYFNLGYGEVVGIVNQVKDVAIIIGFLVLVLKVHINLKTSIIICIVSFGLFTLIGCILKFSGMSDYANKLSNSINPEIKMIPEILKEIRELELCRACARKDCQFTFIKRFKINEKSMNDQEFQAGLPAAMEVAFVAYVAQTGFAATLVAGGSSIQYVPAPVATPPAETVSF